MKLNETSSECRENFIYIKLTHNILVRVKMDLTRSFDLYYYGIKPHILAMRLGNNVGWNDGPPKLCLWDEH